MRKFVYPPSIIMHRLLYKLTKTLMELGRYEYAPGRYMYVRITGNDPKPCNN